MPPLVPGQTIAGKYILDEPLGLGELGPVWVARHATLDAHFAIAFLSIDRAANADARASFEETAKAFAQVTSPHVVTVHDYGVDADVPFAVMDLLEGEKLSARLERQQRVSLGNAVPWVIQIGKALASIHDAGVVHGGVRPENIVFVNNGAGEVLVLGILGMTHALPNASDKALLRAEIPFYDSPEHVRSTESDDPRTDLWSFGVVVFELLTGRVPFPADEIAEECLEIVADPVPAPSKTNPDLGDDVDRFFERALERDPERRFPSAAAMVEAFVALSGAHLVDHGGVFLLVDTDAERTTPVTDDSEPSNDASPAVPDEPIEDKPMPHEDDGALPMADDVPAEKGPWSPVHPKKADPRIGVIVGLLLVVAFLTGVLIVILTKPVPLSDDAMTNDPHSVMEDEDGPIFVPFIPAAANAVSSSKGATKLGGPWPKASASASSSTTPLADDSADAAPAMAPPRPTSIFGF